MSFDVSHIYRCHWVIASWVRNIAQVTDTFKWMEQLVLNSLPAAYSSFRHLGCNSLSLKRLLSDDTASHSGWASSSIMDDSLAVILFSPTPCSQEGSPRRSRLSWPASSRLLPRCYCTIRPYKRSEVMTML